MARNSKVEREFIQSFCEKLREIRKGARLLQKKLAELCGLHRIYIWPAERGERNAYI